MKNETNFLEDIQFILSQYKKNIIIITSLIFFLSLFLSFFNYQNQKYNLNFHISINDDLVKNIEKNFIKYDFCIDKKNIKIKTTELLNLIRYDENSLEKDLFIEDQKKLISKIIDYECDAIQESIFTNSNILNDYFNQTILRDHYKDTLWIEFISTLDKTPLELQPHINTNYKNNELIIELRDSQNIQRSEKFVKFIINDLNKNFIETDLRKMVKNQISLYHISLSKITSNLNSLNNIVNFSNFNIKHNDVALKLMYEEFLKNEDYNIIFKNKKETDDFHILYNQVLNKYLNEQDFEMQTSIKSRQIIFDVISKVILFNYNELFNNVEISNELTIYNNEELLILDYYLNLDRPKFNFYIIILITLLGFLLLFIYYYLKSFIRIIIK